MLIESNEILYIQNIESSVYLILMRFQFILKHGGKGFIKNADEYRRAGPVLGGSFGKAWRGLSILHY